MATDDAAFADRLDRFLDALASGTEHSPNGHPALEPGVAEAIRQLREFDDAPRADPRFANRLLEDLLETTISLDLTVFHVNPALAADREGRAPPWSLPRRTVPRMRWAPAHLATAALIVLTLVGSLIVLGPGRSWRQPSAPVFLPAISATPATPDADGDESASLLDLVIPTISDDKAWVQIDRAVLPPATTLEANGRGGGVPQVFAVVDGALDVRVIEAPEPARVIRAGGTGAEEALTSAGSAALGAGDAFILPENGAADLMNLAVEPASVLLLLLPSDIMPPSNNSIAYESLGGNVQSIRAPLTLSLQQVTLAAGAEIAGTDSPNTTQLVAPVDPARVTDARSGSNGSLRNAGDEPLEAYVLTVSSSTPSAESEIETETLIDEFVDALPAGHAQVTIYATRLQPGVSTAATGQTGMVLLNVEQGKVATTGSGSRTAG